MEHWGVIFQSQMPQDQVEMGGGVLFPGKRASYHHLPVPRQGLTLLQVQMFARLAKIKHCRLGGLNGRHVFAHSSAGCRSKIKVACFSEAPLLDLQGAVFLLCLHITFSLAIGTSGLSPDIRTLVPLD